MNNGAQLTGLKLRGRRLDEGCSVYEEARTGRQYVWDDEGNKVYGLYLIDPDDDEDDPDVTPLYVERHD
jgi:hypothetical protein